MTKGRAFVREYTDQTLVMLMVFGKLPSLLDEGIHVLKVLDDGDDVLTLSVEHVQPTDGRYEGYRVEQLLTESEGPFAVKLERPE